MPDHDDCVTREDIESLVGIAELRELMSHGRPVMISRTYVEQVARWSGFPAPLIVYPRGEGRRAHIRLWLLRDVEAWLDRRQPGWRDLPPPLS